MYSFPNLETVCCSMSSSNCCFLTCIQISQEAGKVVWYSHLFKNFSQFVVIHTMLLLNWCFWTVVLENILESPLDCKEIQPVNPKGNQSWIFSGRTDAEAEAPILWPPDVKNWLIRKDPDAGKIEDGRRREQQRMRWSHGITDLMDMNLSKLRELITHREIWRSAVCGVAQSWTWLSNWTAMITTN